VLYICQANAEDLDVQRPDADSICAAVKANARANTPSPATSRKCYSIPMDCRSAADQCHHRHHMRPATCTMFRPRLPESYHALILEAIHTSTAPGFAVKNSLISKYQEEISSPSEEGPPAAAASSATRLQALAGGRVKDKARMTIARATQRMIWRVLRVLTGPDAQGGRPSFADGSAAGKEMPSFPRPGRSPTCGRPRRAGLDSGDADAADRPIPTRPPNNVTIVRIVEFRPTPTGRRTTTAGLASIYRRRPLQYTHSPILDYEQDQPRSPYTSS